MTDLIVEVPDNEFLLPVGSFGPDELSQLLEMQMLGEEDTAAYEEPSQEVEKVFSAFGLITVPKAEGSHADRAARAVAFMASKVGILESPPYSNYIWAWHDVYPQFLGSPWCAAAIVSAWARQGVDLRKVVPLPYYCPSLETTARKYGAWRPRTSGYSPAAGDLPLYGSGAIATHVGMSAPTSASYSGYRAIEGNTSKDNRGSQTNGNGTWVRHRDGAFLRGWVDMEALTNALVKAGKLKIEKPATTTTKPAVTVTAVSAPIKGNGKPLSWAATEKSMAGAPNRSQMKITRSFCGSKSTGLKWDAGDKAAWSKLTGGKQQRPTQYTWSKEAKKHGWRPVA